MYNILKNYKLTSLHIMVLILGFTGVIGKLVSLSAINLVFYRMLIAFISLAIFLFFKQQLFKINRKDFIEILCVGSLVTIHWICFFQSIKVSNVSIAVVCMATSSLFSSIIEPIFFKRKLITYEVIMGIIVFFALAFVMGTDGKYLSGYFYGILAAFFGTLFTIFNAKYIKKVGAAQITMIEMLSGVIIIGIFLVFFQDDSLLNFFVSFNNIIYMIILGTICTALVFVWMTEIMRHITPFSLIMAINLEPIYSIILALIIFGDNELMSITFYIGASVVIGIVFLEGYLKNKLQ